MQWEATSFGRPVLAVVLIASLALFPVILIPSGPSMWLAGMIFGYGYGFIIIMVGTTIGMVLPFWIGLVFRDRIHVSIFFQIFPLPLTSVLLYAHLILRKSGKCTKMCKWGVLTPMNSCTN